MIIYQFEMKQYFRSLLGWITAYASLIISFLAFFPMFSKDTQLLDLLMENYPKDLLKAFGMGGTLPLSSLFGYLGMTFVYIQICLAIQSANYGFSCLSVEERELTADFLMTKPVSRHTIIFNKFFAAITAMCLSNISVAVCIYGGIFLFAQDVDYELASLYWLFVSGFLFQLVFLSVGMVISVLLKKVRSVLSLSLGMSFSLYVAYALRAVFGGELMGYITPFYYFDANTILEKGHLNGPLTALALGISVVSLTITYIVYLRRNIHSV